VPKLNIYFFLQHITHLLHSFISFSIFSPSFTLSFAQLFTVALSQLPAGTLHTLCCYSPHFHSHPVSLPFTLAKTLALLHPLLSLTLYIPCTQHNIHSTYIHFIAILISRRQHLQLHLCTLLQTHPTCISLPVPPSQQNCCDLSCLHKHTKCRDSYLFTATQ
jgi:hypothetical protein